MPVFKFRGKTIDELKELDTREFAKLLPSRQRRTLLRNFSEIEAFLSRIQKKLNKKKNIKTHNRKMIIVPKMVGLNILVHSGKEFIPIKINSEMLGHRLGEFVATRKRVAHSAPGIGATRSSAALSVK